jgi:NAD-dependent deacetylase
MRSNTIGLIERFCKCAKYYFDWLHPPVVKSLNASPYPNHRVVAEMQRSGIIQTIMIQNIDGLHQKAGAIDVLELHRNRCEMKCSSCEIEYKDPIYLDRYREFRETLICPECGNVFKPNIILDEETLPQKYGVAP